MESGADLFAGDEDGLLIGVVFHEVDAVDGFVVGCESDVDGFDEEFAVEFVEDFLCVEVAPDGGAVCVGCVGVFAADDDVGEAHVLAVDAVHDCFGGPAVEHFDVEAEQEDAVGYGAAYFCPEVGVGVALAHLAVGDELLVGFHSDFGGDIVAFGFTEERVEDGDGVLAFTQEGFEAVDECVFVCAVEWVACLECDGCFVAFIGEELADLCGGLDVGVEVGVGGEGDDFEGAADEVCFVGVVGVGEDDVCAGVVGTFGAVDGFDVAWFVPGEDGFDIEYGDGFAGWVGECDGLAGAECGGEFGCDGE